MPRTSRLFLAALTAVLLVGPMTAADPEGSLTLRAQKRVKTPVAVEVTLPDGTKTRVEAGDYTPVTFEKSIDPKKTAIIICDVWDDHWCKSAAKRCGELAKEAEPMLKAARARGMTIIHAPSDCMKFYADHPARKRTQAIPPVALPRAKDMPSPPLPIDDSDGGCDDATPAKQYRAWSRQHAAISIDAERDYISDDGREVYAILAKQGITTLIVMGVHTNMCVLNRSFAIKQMVKWGVDVLLIRDLTDAMYNPKMRPFVPHERGTGLVIEYIESHWCPTITAKQLASTR